MASRTRKSRTDDQTVFKDLIESAFEFFDRAIAEIDESPKFSTIHFATAVELFLKARLMREHWSLLVDHPDKASRAQFLEGQTRTVTPGQAIARLRNIAGVFVSPEAEKAFGAISEHRNRMIHFTHGPASGMERDALLERIAKEQCLGWYHLDQLLLDWTDHLDGVEPKVRRARLGMKRHARFLQVRFDRIKPEIRAETAKGVHFRKCRSCDLEAARVTRRTDQVSELACEVCEAHDTLMQFQCPLCESACTLLASDGPSTTCSACLGTLGSEAVAEALNTEDIGPDSYFDHTEKNCALCNGYHSVVQHHDLYICSECLEVADTISQCGFCNEQQMGGGDLEFSYRTGCEFCDGANGWEGDD